MPATIDCILMNALSLYNFRFQRLHRRSSFDCSSATRGTSGSVASYSTFFRSVSLPSSPSTSDRPLWRGAALVCSLLTTIRLQALSSPINRRPLKRYHIKKRSITSHTAQPEQPRIRALVRLEEESRDPAGPDGRRKPHPPRRSEGCRWPARDR